MTLETVWQDYRSSLQRFVNARVSNKDDAEDLLQDILLKTHQNIDAIHRQSSVKSWLFQVANNTIIDFYRRKGRELDSVVGSFDRAQEEQARYHLSDCVLPFINALPQEYAELLKAIDIELMSQKEYAKELGISYSTLKSRVQKGRKLLKQLFDECCHYQRDKVGNVYDYDTDRPACFWLKNRSL